MIDYPSASAIILQLKYLLNNINAIKESNKIIYIMNIEMVCMRIVLDRNGVIGYNIFCVTFSEMK